MIKILILSTLLFSGFLQAQILDAKQLFNKKITKVVKEEVSINKSFYGVTKIDESSLVDITSRFDGYITKLNANKKYMTIKKGEPLYFVYSQELLSIQNELQVAKNFNQNIYQSTFSRLDNLDISKSEQQKIKDGKMNSNGLVVTSPINGLLMEKNINQSSAITKGNLLLQMASLDKIWFVASVYQSDLEYIKKDVMLTLPKTAVLKKADKFYIFKPLENGEFEPVKIKAKRIASNKYEILSGLQENDEVINNALFLLDSDAVTNSLYQSDDENW